MLKFVHYFVTKYLAIQGTMCYNKYTEEKRRRFFELTA